MGDVARNGRLYEYGVSRAPVLIDGLPAIWAVDSFGAVRKIRKLRPGDDADALAERLWEWLLTHHPRRTLALVQEVPPAAPTLVRDSRTGRMVDERVLLDPRSEHARRVYFDRLVKSTTRRSGILRFRDDGGRTT